jgi:hypothetical protein
VFDWVVFFLFTLLFFFVFATTFTNYEFYYKDCYDPECKHAQKQDQRIWAAI